MLVNPEKCLKLFGGEGEEPVMSVGGNKKRVVIFSAPILNTRKIITITKSVYTQYISSL